MCLRGTARLPARRNGQTSPCASLLVALGLGILAPPLVAAGQDQPDRRLQQRLDEASRREAEALVELADRAAEGQPVPADFVMSWRPDFLKAQPGTFVPFLLTVDQGGVRATRALMYVRAVRRSEPAVGAATSQGRRDRRERYAFDAIFSVELRADAGQPVRITKGFAVPAGDYDVYVALRERPEDPQAPGSTAGLKSAVLKRSVQVPDFWSGEFATSTIMLAHRIDALARQLSPEEALERPYAIGTNDVHIAFDATFRSDRELIVVFVIYDPTVGVGGEFDVQVDYHVFRRARGGREGATGEGEEYLTRTSPQRFNRRTLGTQINPAAGHPVMAGQGILLSSFEAGEYRLGITVTDLLSGQRLTRDVTFRVAGS